MHQNYISTPMVVTRTSAGERAMDIYSMMIEKRTIFLTGQVNDAMSQAIVAQLLYLDHTKVAPIHLYINSPGGVVTSGLAIADTMDIIKSPVHTYVVGHAASMGSYLAQYGAPGFRHVAPRSRTMIHDPSGGAQGIWSDMKASLKEMEVVRSMLIDGYLRHNTKGKTREDFEANMERDTWFSAEEAVEFGLADTVLSPKI